MSTTLIRPFGKPFSIKSAIQPRKTKIILALLLILVTSLLSYLSLKESLKTALSGDDWLLLYTIWMNSVVRKSVSYWDVSTYLSTYGPPYGFMSIIKHFFGYQPFYYYLTSLIIKVGASISIFFLIKKITKNLLVAILACFIFAASYLGIQSSDWVFNFNHYIGIIASVLFLITYYKVKEKQTLLSVLVTAFLFGLSLVVSPNRMHGLFPLVLLVELAWFLINRKKYNFRKALIRVVVLLIVYRIVFSGAGYGSTEYNLGQVKKGVESASEMLSKGQTWFLLNPISSLGNYIVPDRLYQQLPLKTLAKLFLNRDSFYAHTLILLGFVGAFGATLLTLLKSKKSTVVGFAASLLVWSFIMKFVKRLNPVDYSIQNADLATIGGGIIIITFFLFRALKKTKPLLAHTLLVSLGWMLVFTLFFWVLAPYSVLDSSLRYSLQQSVGSAIWFSIIFYILLNKLEKHKRLKIFFIPSIVLLFLFFVMNITYSNQYFTELNLHRSADIDRKLWSQITSEVKEIPKDSSSLFYLKYDDYLTAEKGLRSGFSARAAMHYNIRNQNNNPYMIFNYDDVVSIVTEGSAWSKQGEPSLVTPVNQAFAFELKNNNISNITQATRDKLQEKIKLHNETSK